MLYLQDTKLNQKAVVELSPLVDYNTNNSNNSPDRHHQPAEGSEELVGPSPEEPSQPQHSGDSKGSSDKSVSLISGTSPLKCHMKVVKR